MALGQSAGANCHAQLTCGHCTRHFVTRQGMLALLAITTRTGNEPKAGFNPPACRIFCGFMEKIYLDSNVFIAFIKTEIGKPFRLMFKDVETFFARCSGRYTIILSGHTLREIENIVHYSAQQTADFFITLGIDVEIIKEGDREIKDAKEYSEMGVHKADAPHVAIAINGGCKFIVTFNKKDFLAVEGLIQILEPEEVI